MAEVPDPPATDAATEARQKARRYIVIRGARQHNLQDINLDLPKGKLIS